MSAKRTLRATRAPASWRTRATALSRGSARGASAPDVAHAALWSPSGSRWPRQAHVRGSGRRSRRSSKMRKCAEGTVTSPDVGKTVRVRVACGPACDSSSARDTESRSERCVSSARWSLAEAASRCHPCKKVHSFVLLCRRALQRPPGMRLKPLHAEASCRVANNKTWARVCRGLQGANQAVGDAKLGAQVELIELREAPAHTFF